MQKSLKVQSKLSVTVITPSYNQGRFIEETIQSVLAQDIGELEYWVMDGGSTDETVAILKKYQDRLQWLSEKDKGQANAVNKGLQAAKGEIIGWLNSDDLYCPHALKNVCAYFEEHPDVEVVYGKASQVDEAGNPLHEDYLTEAFDVERLKRRCFLSQPAVFFRRSVFERLGLLREDLHLCLDYEYWLRLALKGVKFAYIPEFLAIARIYSDTKSARCFLESHREALSMLHEHLGTVPAEWLVNYSTAKVKTEHHFEFPDPRFLLYSWGNLWKASGLYSQGLAHWLKWIEVQGSMLKKFLIRLFPQSVNG